MNTQENLMNLFDSFGKNEFSLVKKEIKELPNILWENEKVENAVQGFYNNGQALVVGTNKRLIFIDKGMIMGLKVEDFGYDKITSIQYETGFVFGKITIFASGNKAIIDNVIKSKTKIFGEWIRNKISSKNETTEINNKHSNLIEQLEKLALLKEKGILTEEEFIVQKTKLLS